MLLKGKNAIITGSNQGFGKVIAEEFLKEGANVIICARNYELVYKTYKELSTNLQEGQKLYPFSLDISSPESIRRFHWNVLDVFRNVDIIVNNAGIYGVKGLVDINNLQAWKETIDTNLIGTVNMCMEFVSHMKSNNYGKIINIAGGGALNPRTHFSAYATSKAGVVRFSECLAEELREFNIDVNCISPGALNTRIIYEAVSEGAEKIGKEYYEKTLKQLENGGDSPQAGAELCVFLASKKCDGITGKTISAKWDEWKDLPNHKQELKQSDIYTLRRISPWDINPYWMEKI